MESCNISTLLGEEKWTTLHHRAACEINVRCFFFNWVLGMACVLFLLWFIPGCDGT